jgi:hypothetical protein
MIELKQFFLANPDYILIFSGDILKLVSTIGRVTLVRRNILAETNYMSTLRQKRCFVKRSGCGKVLSYDRLNFASTNEPEYFIRCKVCYDEQSTEDEQLAINSELIEEFRDILRTVMTKERDDADKIL